MACWICLPTCDKCQPKFVDCPHCGNLALLVFDECPVCHEPITEADKRRGVEAWNEKRKSDQTLAG